MQVMQASELLTVTVSSLHLSPVLSRVALPLPLSFSHARPLSLCPTLCTPLPPYPLLVHLPAASPLAPPVGEVFDLSLSLPLTPASASLLPHPTHRPVPSVASGNGL